MLNIRVGGCRQVIVIASHRPDDYTRRIKGRQTLQNSIGLASNKKGQLYKETSANTIPHKKFGNKLHFKAQELLAWAESKLIDGNAVGVLSQMVLTD